MASIPSSFTIRVAQVQAGYRLDTIIAAEIEQLSRSFAATLIRQGSVTVDGTTKKPGYSVKAGEEILGRIPPPDTQSSYRAEAIPLDILFEDNELLIVNKPPGMVVHTAPGHRTGTLVNALMHHCPQLSGISGTVRPGIVHRLDKDTSGALVVAKTACAMRHLAAQFKSRAVQKHYLALVYGIPSSAEGTIDLPIGRHHNDRKKMSIHTHTPRGAFTHYRVQETFVGAALLRLDIRTGRTHQIRVHCQALGHPVIGDSIYKTRGAIKQLEKESRSMADSAVQAGRQMLHAFRLRITHPVTKVPITATAPIPDDMAGLIDRFRLLTAGSASMP